MLAGKTVAACSSRCRQYTTGRGLRPVPTLANANLETFREAFQAETPALIPRGTFNSLPAVSKWFIKRSKRNAQLSLNRAYLDRYGSTIVPLEITNDGQFARIEHSLSFFIESVNAHTSRYEIDRPDSRFFSAHRVLGRRPLGMNKMPSDFFSASATAVPVAVTIPTARVYLAQAELRDLPRGLQDDVPTPELVLGVGKGDIYSSSLWLGLAPTYTPLHRDPNPNLFVQLAGTKKVRLFSPGAGRNVFAKVQERIGASASANMRGTEMMEGVERKALEEEVWQRDDLYRNSAYEAELSGGDGLFIPKGWWHSVKGTGKGMTGSVNWWFR